MGRDGRSALGGVLVCLLFAFLVIGLLAGKARAGVASRRESSSVADIGSRSTVSELARKHRFARPLMEWTAMANAVDIAKSRLVFPFEAVPVFHPAIDAREQRPFSYLSQLD